MTDTKIELERLRTLYSISKKLSLFTRIEDSFADIVACAAESFPLKSAVLIEHWESEPRTAIWSIENVTPEITTRAVQNAKHAYSYFSGASPEKARELLNAITPKNVLLHNERALIFNETETGHYITVPLIIDNLPPLGALQLEGTSKLDEGDLDFVIALANLVSVALDRFYKTKKEYQRQRNEVLDLESQRDLREAFVNLLTHDLRTPMSVILGSAQMILKKPDDTKAIKKSADRIVTHVERAGKMISDLLDANLIHSGEGLHAHKEKVNVTDLVKKTLDELSIINPGRFHFEGSGNIVFSLDSNGLRRIVENLCNNAIKYGSKTDPVTIKLEEDSLDIVLSVSNLGSYILPEDQETLFQQFHRTSSAHSGEVEGWGIGLTLVRGVAEAHGGKVSVSSDPVTGTVFTVTLPKGK
jgi:signal transduction histidine kinase